METSGVAIFAFVVGGGGGGKGGISGGMGRSDDESFLVCGM